MVAASASGRPNLGRDTDGMMSINRLLERATQVEPAVAPIRLLGDGSATVSDVTNDSNEVRDGAVFCCVRGERHDGHAFAGEAVRRGAVALLVDHPLDEVKVPQIVAGDTREAMGHLAAAFYDHPSHALAVVGVTGTNGKTTTAHMLGSMLEQSGRKTTVIGTLTGVRTTPEAPELQRTLATERLAGTQAVVMEVSSHALSLKRVVGTHFAAAVFTNLGHDHLDFHGSREEYFAAKASLFRRSFTPLAVVNRDDEYGRRLAGMTDTHVVTYGRDDATEVEVASSTSTFSWRGSRLRCGVGGDFNVMNAIAAATTAAELGVASDGISAGLANLPRIPGRFEDINPGGDFAVVVDYAHTPEALRQVLASARLVARGRGRVIVVFGCGGDRDSGKRPAMGIAACDADRVIVTSDNPRNEDARAIIDSITAGVPADKRNIVTVEMDRRRAIELGCGEAARGDVVVIAGRGHERFQEISGRLVPFDDAEVARSVLGVSG